MLLAARFCFLFYAPADPFRIPFYVNELIVEALVDLVYGILAAGQTLLDDTWQLVSRTFV